MNAVARARLGIITACTTGNVVSMTPAVHAVFGIFLIPLSHSFGWSRASISGVLGIIALAGALIYPVAGRYADRHGARTMVLLGNLMLAGAIALLALTDGNIVHFYLTFTLIAIAGSIPSTAIFSKIVSDWFDGNRGMMLGISSGGGNALGSTLMPVAAAVLLSSAGWRGAYLGIAALVAGIGFPTLYFLLRDAPRYDGATATAQETAVEANRAAGMTLAQAARTRAFWLILLAIAFGAGCLTAVFSHVVPILAERSISLATGTAVLSVFALVCAAWQITCGTLFDRIATPRIAAPMYLAAVGGLAMLELGNGLGALLVGGALLGIGLGTQYGALPFFIARYFGLRSFGTIIGALYSAVVILQGITPLLLDHMFDVTGSYRLGIMGIGLCMTAGAGLLLLLPPYGERAAAAEAETVPAPTPAPALNLH